MTSQIKSHTHKTNDCDFEFGAVGVKGCCGKMRWSTMKQGDVWTNGVFCEDECLPGGFKNSGMAFCHPEPCMSEPSEVDWISKEIAFQELICNDKPSHWIDTSNGKGDCAVKEEHDIDIVSTLTAVAALFRDWCAVDTDLSEQMVDRFQMSSNNKNDRQRDWIWLDAPIDLASNPSNVVTPFPVPEERAQWNDYDMVWSNVAYEQPDNQKAHYNASFCNDLVDEEEVAKDNSWDTQGNRCSYSLSSKNIMSPFQDDQYTEGENDIGNTCIYPEFGRTASFSVIDGCQNSSLSPLVDIDRYMMFGSQSPAASRYSFGREGSAGSSASSGEVVSPLFNETNFFSEAGSSSADSNKVGASLHNNAKDENNLCASKPEVMMHEALLYALSYMTLHDLLTMERVSKSMRDSVRSDVLLWQQLHIKPPTSKNFTDEVFCELASRSRGQLQSLTLVECTRITEAALEHVVSLNPRLTKLALPGCTRISADAVVRMVEILTNHKKTGKHRLKQLRVRNIYGLTVEHLEYLKRMIGVDTQFPYTHSRPQYYHNGHHTSTCADERAIDVEECPKCSNVRIIYDCTRERCQQRRGNHLHECRACILCIVRCEECGRCINDNEYEETFSLDFLCSCCWLRLPKCAECNRPGCGQHADHFIRAPDTTLVCSDCSSPDSPH